MSPTAKSIYCFSFYLLAAGVLLFAVPNIVLSTLHIPTTSEIWIRLVGTLTFILGIFFFTMAKQNVRQFFPLSLAGRGTFIVAIVLLVIFYRAPRAILIFAAIDLIGFIWTWVSLRQEK